MSLLQSLPHMLQTGTDAVIDNVRTYCKANQYDSARKLLSAALVADPDNARLHFWLGKTWHHCNKFTEALAAFNLALKADANCAEAAICLIALYCDLGRYQDGIELYTQLRRYHDPARGLHKLALHKLAQQHMRCGDLYVQMGKRPEAQREYQRALLLARDNSTCRLRLAVSCYFAVSLDRGREEIDTVLAAEPEHFEALLWSGLAFYQQDDQQRATEQWEKARRLRPQDATVRALIRMNA